jgi:hypothetical protein
MVDTSQSHLIPLGYDENFFNDYGGRLISDPQVAIVELIANSWDAGAKEVKLRWPDQIGGLFEIFDNGTGMTKQDFERCWTTFNYNRVRFQGTIVTLPESSGRVKRKVYGKNGKGRHSLFCFSNSYLVETWKDGTKSIYSIKKIENSTTPYQVELQSEGAYPGHGTKISCTIERNYIENSDIEDLLGSKFIADPSFEISLNGVKIDPQDFLQSAQHVTYELPNNEGSVEIFIIESKTGRISKHHGVAWWVNNRLVGDHSWKDFDNTYLDGRTSAAKKYTIVVKADVLEDDVRVDWTGFKQNDHSKRIKESVNSFILQTIQNLMKEIRSDAKREIIEDQKPVLKNLGNFSRQQIGTFIDEVQMRCPTINQSHLSNIVEVLAKMEMSRSGYKLLQQLSTVSTSEIDKFSAILEEWSITDAKEVLDELQWRLALIQKLDSLIGNPDTDELHDLQPLFNEGLWIFGPEFEGVRYFSNRTLLTIVKDLFNSNVTEYPKNRPDFLILPNSTIGLRASDRYEEDNVTVKGFSKIIIIELKKGGFKITYDELLQTQKYAIALQNSCKLDANTKIVCYVLGDTIECKKSAYGDSIEVIPLPYVTIVRNAHTRTFNLMERIKLSKRIEETFDKEMNSVLAQQEFSEF